MHNSTTLSCSLPRKMVPNKKKVLPLRLSFEVKITGVIDFDELKCRICANGLRMIEGQDYKISYTLTTDGESLRFMIAMVPEEDKKLSFINSSNTFQINGIFNLEDRQKNPYQYFISNGFDFAFPNMR